MARPDGMDALMTLGLLGAMLKDENSDAVSRMTASGKCPIPTREHKKVTPAEGAKAAKELYDSYVEAGFNEVQAFELTKLVLTNK